jgi:hypothetical protein
VFLVPVRYFFPDFRIAQLRNAAIPARLAFRRSTIAPFSLLTRQRQALQYRWARQGVLLKLHNWASRRNLSVLVDKVHPADQVSSG